MWWCSGLSSRKHFQTSLFDRESTIFTVLKSFGTYLMHGNSRPAWSGRMWKSYHSQSEAGKHFIGRQRKTNAETSSEKCKSPVYAKDEELKPRKKGFNLPSKNYLTSCKMMLLAFSLGLVPVCTSAVVLINLTCRGNPALEQHQCFADIYWDQIAYEQFDNKRSPEDCRLYYKNCVGPEVNSSPWSKDEERRLLGLVTKYSMRAWETVSVELGSHRTAFSCLKHYQQCINPNTHEKYALVRTHTHK